MTRVFQYHVPYIQVAIKRECGVAIRYYTYSHGEPREGEVLDPLLEMKMLKMFRNLSSDPTEARLTLPLTGT